MVTGQKRLQGEGEDAYGVTMGQKKLNVKFMLIVEAVRESIRQPLLYRPSGTTHCRDPFRLIRKCAALRIGLEATLVVDTFFWSGTRRDHAQNRISIWGA